VGPSISRCKGTQCASMGGLQQKRTHLLTSCSAPCCLGAGHSCTPCATSAPTACNLPAPWLPSTLLRAGEAAQPWCRKVAGSGGSCCCTVIPCVHHWGTEGPLGPANQKGYSCSHLHTSPAPTSTHHQPLLLEQPLPIKDPCLLSAGVRKACRSRNTSLPPSTTAPTLLLPDSTSCSPQTVTPPPPPQQHLSLLSQPHPQQAAPPVRRCRAGPARCSAQSSRGAT
jgi:hypothetical protein